MNINGRAIGYGNPVYVVCEISANHCGSLDLAKQLIREAKDAGADACKVQLYTPDELTVNSDHPAYVLTEGPWKGRTLYDLYTEAQTPREWMPELFAYAKEIGITLFASVFSVEGVAYLESLGCPAYKIASAEVTCLDLVRAVAATGKPVIISDGLATSGQVGWACHALGASDHVLLRCVSEYPAPPESYGLGDFRSARMFGPHFGISDHTVTNDVAIAAVALGACVVEKHLMLSAGAYFCRDMAPPLDANHSVDPDGFADYVQAIRRTEAMIQPSKPKEATGEFRRRLVFARDMQSGEAVTPKDTRARRCREGFEPDIGEFGKPLERNVKAGDPVTWHSFNLLTGEVA